MFRPICEEVISEHEAERQEREAREEAEKREREARERAERSAARQRITMETAEQIVMETVAGEVKDVAEEEYQ